MLAGVACMNSSQSPTEVINENGSTGSVVLNVSNGDGVLSKAVITSEIAGVEHVWLTIKQVDVHTSGGGWVTIAQPYQRYDFLKLVNGLTVPLELYPLPVGHYTQIRLILAGDGDGEGGPTSVNEIIVNGQGFPIKIPSGTQTGIKCVHQFTIEPGQQTEICLQFDVLKAIVYNNGNGYILKPAYKTVFCNGSQNEDIPG
jgi:hypothetical protein